MSTLAKVSAAKRALDRARLVMRRASHKEQEAKKKADQADKKLSQAQDKLFKVSEAYAIKRHQRRKKIFKRQAKMFTGQG